MVQNALAAIWIQVIIVPETITREELVEEVQKVKETIIEVAKPIIQEKIVEVPEIEYRDKIVERVEKIVQEKIREVPKIEYQDRIIEVSLREKICIRIESFFFIRCQKLSRKNGSLK